MADTIDPQPVDSLPLVTLELAFAAPLFQRWQAAAAKIQPDPSKIGILTLSRIRRGLENELIQMESEALAAETREIRKNSIVTVRVKA